MIVRQVNHPYCFERHVYDRPSYHYSYDKVPAKRLENFNKNSIFGFKAICKSNKKTLAGIMDWYINNYVKIKHRTSFGGPMNEDRHQEPRERFRNILSSNDDETDTPHQPPPESQPQFQSPLAQLPHLKPSAQQTPASETQAVAPQRSKGSPPDPSSTFIIKSLRFGPPFWTITGILSLIVNGILIAILFSLLNMLGPLQGLSGTASNVGSSVLGGLYSNFEKMDRAHIRTDIPISTEIPVQFDIQISTQTDVVLSQDVNITGARVTLQTGGLEIVQAPTNIILPAGTVLPINLNLTVPVDKSVPVNMIVPVDIALNQTDLHDPFVGLQDVLRPLYCLVEPHALKPGWTTDLSVRLAALQASGIS